MLRCIRRRAAWHVPSLSSCLLDGPTRGEYSPLLPRFVELSTLLYFKPLPHDGVSSNCIDSPTATDPSGRCSPPSPPGTISSTGCFLWGWTVDGADLPLRKPCRRPVEDSWMWRPERPTWRWRYCARKARERPSSVSTSP